MTWPIGKLARVLASALAAAAATVAWGGAVAPAWSAVQGRAAGVRPLGVRGGSAIGAAGSAGSWRRAIEVPGLGALNKGGDAQVTSVSCGAAGNCAAGGDYTDRRGHGQGFVIVERHGRWGRAIEVPGLAALNTGDAGVSSVSCASAGSCTAIGLYVDRGGHLQVFAASQRQGRWGKATEVPGLGALNKGGNADDSAFVSEVSCAPAGSCAAGGGYTDQAGNTQGFVASERDGRWGQVIEVPGLGALNKDGGADVYSVSCGAAGSCAAGGDYIDGGGNGQGFVAVERHGRWGKAIKVPGLGTLNKGGGAGVSEVSCAPTGSCAAGGSYTDRHGHSQGFVVSQTG